jgi:predicted RNA binding protein YcfA (HicA-like mRNA interferase family)
MKRRDIEKKLRALGWLLARHGSRHRDLVVPRHNEINEYTAKAILKEAGGGES